MKEKTNKSILTLADGIETEFNYHVGIGISKIAENIGKNRSAVYREIDAKSREGRNRCRVYIAHEKALKGYLIVEILER